MKSMRNIQIKLTDEFQDVTVETRQEVYSAIGYLSMWAVDSQRYNDLRLYGDRGGDIFADYRKDGVLTYSLFAQRGEDGKYSFHS